MSDGEKSFITLTFAHRLSPRQTGRHDRPDLLRRRFPGITLITFLLHRCSRTIS
jgi:hypothetical protein